DADLFRPGPVEDPGRTPTVLYVGRLEPLKGVDTLVEALGLAAPSVDFRCVLIGRESAARDGATTKERLRATLARSACLDRATFIDHIGRGSLVAHYQQASLCVVPSLYENCPYTLLEAMACGKPVVATRVGGIPEVVEEGITGHLVPARDPAKLAAAIERLLRDPGERRRLGRN